MGMVPFSAAPLFLEGARAPFSGTMVQLGRQDIFFSREEFVHAAQLCGLTPREEPRLPTLSLRPHCEKEVITDQEFFLRLGFDKVYALDFFDDHKENGIVADLNREDAAAGYDGAFDFVLDGGTIEHIFHVPNVLKTIHRLLKVGGRVMHFAPASNMVNHGFYSFSPALFLDYYRANGYALRSVQLQRIQPGSLCHTWVIDLYPDEQGLGELVSRTGSLDDFAYNVLVVAEKTADSRSDQIPAQGIYSKPPVSPVPLQVGWVNAPATHDRPTLPWRKLGCLGGDDY